MNKKSLLPQEQTASLTRPTTGSAQSADSPTRLFPTFLLVAFFLLFLPLYSIDPHSFLPSLLHVLTHDFILPHSPPTTDKQPYCNQIEHG